MDIEQKWNVINSTNVWFISSKYSIFKYYIKYIIFRAHIQV